MSGILRSFPTNDFFVDCVCEENFLFSLKMVHSFVHRSVEVEFDSKMVFTCGDKSVEFG